MEEQGFHSLPPEIGKLHNLRELYLGFNQLTSLPAEIGQLRILQVLSLSTNIRIRTLMDVISLRD